MTNEREDDTANSFLSHSSIIQICIYCLGPSCGLKFSKGPQGHQVMPLHTYVCGGNLQPEAIGHTQTCLQLESGDIWTCTVCDIVNLHTLLP